MTEVAMDKVTISATDAEIERTTVRKVAVRLMWFIMALYFLAILDRGNIAFAALQMNKELGLNAGMFGVSVGITYFTYALFEIPSNVALARYGARSTLTRIALLWGIATVLMAFTRGPLTLYTFRGLLGLAESGLFPGVMLLLSIWFPFSYRARYNAMFNYAVPVSYIFGSLISGAILELDGTFGLSGWKWLFVLEGLPPILLGVIGISYLTDRPQQASWLRPAERSWLIGAIERDAEATGTVHGEGVLKTITKPMVLLFGLCNFGLFGGLTSLFPWLPQIIKTFGLPASQVGLVTAIPPIAGLVGMMALSRHSDHVGERFYYAITTFLVAASGFAIAAFAATPLWMIIGFIVANVGIYGTQAVFWTIPQSYMSRQSAPGAIGLVSTIGSIGGAIMPIVIGRAKDLSGGYTDGFLVVSGVLVFSAILILVARSSLVRT